MHHARIARVSEPLGYNQSVFINACSHLIVIPTLHFCHIILTGAYSGGPANVRSRQWVALILSLSNDPSRMAIAHFKPITVALQS
jgi:hypothetical protein